MHRTEPLINRDYARSTSNTRFRSPRLRPSVRALANSPTGKTPQVMLAPGKALFEALLPGLFLSLVLAVRWTEILTGQTDWTWTFLVLALLLLSGFVLASRAEGRPDWRARLLLLGVAALPLALTGLGRYYFQHLLPSHWQPLEILPPLLLLSGLGCSWHLLLKLLPSRNQTVGEWLPARLFLLTLAVSLLRLL